MTMAQFKGPKILVLESNSDLNLGMSGRDKSLFTSFV